MPIFRRNKSAEQQPPPPEAQPAPPAASGGDTRALLGDDAITDGSEDRLGRVRFAERMGTLIEGIASQTPSAV